MASSTHKTPDFSARNILVTGASGNLGQAVVHKFIREGYHVIGTVTTPDTTLHFPDQGFEKVVADLTKEAETEKIITALIEKYKNIDAAVLTVGGFAMGNIAETSGADLYKQYQLNFETAYHTARPVFLHMMKQNRGRIFLIGSRPGLDAKNSKGMIGYGLAKSLIFRLAEILNAEAKDHQVVTSVLVPGTIDTPQNRQAMPDADFSRWVKPEAIADIIYFYCTPEAASVREPVIKVYGNG